MPFSPSTCDAVLLFCPKMASSRWMLEILSALSLAASSTQSFRMAAADAPMVKSSTRWTVGAIEGGMRCSNSALMTLRSSQNSLKRLAAELSRSRSSPKSRWSVVITPEPRRMASSRLNTSDCEKPVVYFLFIVSFLQMYF